MEKIDEYYTLQTVMENLKLDLPPEISKNVKIMYALVDHNNQTNPLHASAISLFEEEIQKIKDGLPHSNNNYIEPYQIIDIDTVINALRNLKNVANVQPTLEALLKLKGERENGVTNS